MTSPAAKTIQARRFKTARTVLALMLREMSTTYGRTPGGYAWAVIEPVAGVAMFTLVMVAGLKIRTPALGISFPLFFATGMLPFTMFNGISNKVESAIAFSRPLLAYPGVTFLDALLARLILTVLTKLMVFYIVIAGILLLFDTRAILSFEPILQSLALIILLGAGIGSLNCYLISTFPIWDKFWGILTTPLFLVSGVIFLYDSMPQFGQDILWYNPLIHVIGLMRRGFYPTYDAPYVSIPYAAGIGLGTLALGLLLLFRYHKDILNR